MTVKDYYIGLQGFFKWLVREEILDASPLAKVEKPRVCEEVKQPLTPREIEALQRAAPLHPTLPG